MKRLRYTFLLFLWVSFGAMAQKITTLSPYVEEQSQPEVALTKVELTDDYTILHFRFEFTQRTPSLRDFFGERQGNLDRNYIEVDPKSRLYEPKNTAKKFKFIKAVGIPVAPETRTVYPVDVVKFSFYYERLDPGI